MSRVLGLSRRHAVYAAEVLLAGTVTFNLTACSVLLPVGAVRANQRFPQGELRVHRVGRLPGHPPVRIITASGDTVSGRFSRVRLMPLNDYARRYAEWREAAHQNFPALGEDLVASSEKGREVHGKFSGFGVGTLWLRRGWDEAEHPLEDLESLTRPNEDEFPLDSMLAMARRNQLPSRAVVRLILRSPSHDAAYAEENGWALQIPVDDVRGVIIDGAVAHPGAAFLGGVALDGLTVLMVAAAASDQGGRGNGSGCDYNPDAITWGTSY